MNAENNLDRRQLIRNLGALGLGAAAAGPLTATPVASPQLVLPAGLPAPATRVLKRMCVLTPTATQGPFYVNSAMLRRDVTEGKPGLPLILFVLVVRASDCSPIPNAVVDMWQCDALGSYSGFASQGTAGQTFLRGVQPTDSIGLAWFETIYPGYYPGRTAHHHLKVHLNNQTLVTTQLYFNDAVTDQVYALLPPYNTRGPRNTRNANDGIFTASTVMTLLLDPGGQVRLLGGLVIGVA